MTSTVQSQPTPDTPYMWSTAKSGWERNLPSLLFLKEGKLQSSVLKPAVRTDLCTWPRYYTVRTIEGCNLCEYTSGADTTQLGQWKDVTCVNILDYLLAPVDF